MKDFIRLLALTNAVRYHGKANPKALVGAVVKEFPSCKEDMKGMQALLSSVVDEVNALSVEEQRIELERLDPARLEKKKEERDVFAVLDLPDQVVTGFPPEASKYLHLGHAKAAYVNYLLAKQKGGQFILRLDDTNPLLAKQEFYDIIQEDLTWLGISWDKLVIASDYLAQIIAHAKTLLEKKLAYVCTCSAEQMHAGRKKKERCTCAQENRPFSFLEEARAGEAVLRLKIDMAHQNTTMTDPTILRLIDEPHVHVGSAFRTWPTYDFATAILDAENGITFRIRGKEFELRVELQHWIQEKLGLRVTKTYEFGRFNIAGAETSGRTIREKIAAHEFIGWDDPRLVTLVALRRRGFTPEALTSFLLSTGLSKSESMLTWDDLIMHNKRVLDTSAKRYFFIPEPLTKVTITGAPLKDVHLKRLPSDENKERVLPVTCDEFFLAKDDVEAIQDGEVVRLIDYCNVKKENGSFVFVSENFAEFKGKGKKIIHFLPVHESLVEVSVMNPDTTVVSGKAEAEVAKLANGEIIQFERFGFCRKDSKNTFWFAH
ncbi:MAG: glutamate--tRNA ligase [Candidatus Woesearchaeota archaeon]|nr:MAG: glutamate--tRNA ligase [Candidatus Woesearchaeota archaeon]